MSLEKYNPAKQRKAVEAVRREETVMKTQVSKVKSNEAILEEFSFDDLLEVDLHHKNVMSTVKGFGSMSVINHDKCGRRIHLANDIWRQLGCPQFLRVFLKAKQMFVIAGTDYGIAVKFDRKIPFEEAVDNYNGKVVLYATETVKSITKEWNLEFDSNCCYTGGTHKKCTINGIPAIVISKEAEVEEASVANDTEDVADTTEDSSVDAVGDEI